MKIRSFALILSAFFLITISCSAFSERFLSDKAEQIILGQLYVGSISIERPSLDANHDSELHSVDKSSAITETLKITVSGSSLEACETTLLEILNQHKNVISSEDCKAKGLDLSMIAINRDMSEGFGKGF